jgi:putative DNA-invertase from lambdoid prophage Rac
MVFDGTTTDPMQQAIRDSLLAFMAASGTAAEAAPPLSLYPPA